MPGVQGYEGVRVDEGIRSDRHRNHSNGVCDVKVAWVKELMTS